MSETLTKATCHKIATALAYTWVWGYFMENNELPTWIALNVYQKDIELMSFEGKKVKITMEIVDE